MCLYRVENGITLATFCLDINSCVAKLFKKKSKEMIKAKYWIVILREGRETLRSTQADF